MSHIPQINYVDASAEIRRANDAELALRGRMTNMKRVLFHLPVAHRVYAEWFAMTDELRPQLGDRAIWVLSEAVSEA